MSKDLNSYRHVKGIDSNLHDYDRIKETINENRFSLCHLGESVMRLYAEKPNDADLGKLVRELINSVKERR